MILTTDSRIIGIDSNNKQVRLCRFEVDAISELPAPDVWTSDGVIICMGSSAHVIGDNSEHMLDSSGQWVQQVAGTSSYTRAEIDSFLSAINAENTSQQTEINYSINAGAKNFAPIETGENVTGNKWVVGAGSGNAEKIDLPAGQYIFTAISESSGSGQCQIKLTYSDGTTSLTETFSFGSAMTLAFTAAKTVVGYGVYSNAAPVTFKKMMIRPAVITDQTYEPYAPTNRQLYEMILQLQGG